MISKSTKAKNLDHNYVASRKSNALQTVQMYW